MSQDWQELSSPEQIQTLMHLFGNFHDGCVREIHVATSHYVTEDLSMHFDAPLLVGILVQRQFPSPSAIELRFAEVVGLRFSPPAPNYDAIIRSAAFFLRDGIFYWAEDGSWTPESPGRDDYTWVAARRVWWRDASRSVGPGVTLRPGGF